VKKDNFLTAAVYVSHDSFKPALLTCPGHDWTTDTQTCFTQWPTNINKHWTQSV